MMNSRRELEISMTRAGAGSAKQTLAPLRIPQNLPASVFRVPAESSNFAIDTFGGCERIGSFGTFVDSAEPRGTTSKDPVEQRSYVTLLFSDLCDYTELSELVDPEEMNELRRTIELAAQRVVAKHAGEINQFVGDGLLAVFGFPKADENGVEHAIEAALELHAAIRTLSWPHALRLGRKLFLHSGVHCGIVFVRQGDPRHGRYELTGDPVNTASRLCQAASRDEVLVSEAGVRGIEALFDATAIAPLHLKGKQRPVQAYRIRGLARVESRFEARSHRGLTPFIGRSSELAALEEALSGAIEGRGCVRRISGDAGIGKTRLLAELQRRAKAAGVQACRGWSENYGGAPPLRPFLQIARTLLPLPADTGPELSVYVLEQKLIAIDDALREHLQAFLHLLSVRPFSESSTLDDLQLAVVPALFDLVIASARRQPLLLVLDDWQWADGASLQVLGRLVRVAREHRLMIVVGAREARTDDPVLGQVGTLQLTPFLEHESVSAVEEILPQAIAPGGAADIHRRSGGNPLFLEEICRSLALAVGGQYADPAQHEIPNTVYGLIQARIQRLDPNHARLLQAASVIGNEIPIWLLSAVHADATMANTLSELFDEGLLEERAQNGVAFKHGITREVVYESVRVQERRELHLMVAGAIEVYAREGALADHFETLAVHYAGGAAWARALEYAELAGEKASQSSALDQARAHYAAALAHIDRLPESPELRRRWLTNVARWCAVCVFSPTSEQIQVLLRAIDYAEALSDFAALASSEYWTSWIYYALGDQQSAIRHAERALALAESAHNDALKAQLLSNLGQIHAAAGSYALALRNLDQGIAMKRARSGRGKRSVPVGFAYALGCRALVHGDQGHFSAAYSQLQEALEVLRDTDHAIEGSLLCLLGMIQLWQGAWQEALDTSARGRATGERVNGPYVLAICKTVSSRARWVLGKQPAALNDLSDAVVWLERRDIRLYLSFAQSQLAEALLTAQDFEGAETYARRALERGAPGEPLGAPAAYRVLARLDISNENFESAQHHCADALALARARSSERELTLTALVLGELALREQRLGDARKLLSGACVALESMSMRWYLAEAASLLGEC